MRSPATKEKADALNIIKLKPEYFHEGEDWDQTYMDHIANWKQTTSMYPVYYIFLNYFVKQLQLPGEDPLQDVQDKKIAAESLRETFVEGQKVSGKYWENSVMQSFLPKYVKKKEHFSLLVKHDVGTGKTRTCYTVLEAPRKKREAKEGPHPRPSWDQKTFS